MGWYGKPWVGVAAALFVLFAVSSGYFLAGERIFMNGGLSMRHTGLSNDCSSCHTPWLGADDAKCVRCHGATLNHKTDARHKKVSCVDCHGEHGGERMNIAYASDGDCAQCHKNMSHKKKDPAHTQEFARKGLLMTHATHLETVKFNRTKCLTCHKNLDFIRAMTVATPMKDMMARHLERIPDIACPDCHNPVEIAGFTDASGGAMVYGKCRTCHERKKISGACSYCHRFHYLPHDYKGGKTSSN